MNPKLKQFLIGIRTILYFFVVAGVGSYVALWVVGAVDFL